jgi:hypothetical protein
LEKVADENNTHEFQIFNFDKSAFSAVQKQDKILGQKPQISALSHRDTVNTILCYACASGLTVPTFKYKRTKHIGAPTGSQTEMSKSSHTYLN